MIEHAWMKPCGPDCGNCVEVDLSHPGTVYVRDSKLGEDGIVLTFTAEEWEAHIGAVKGGQYDLPKA